jgi:hypothetical protein
MLFNKRDEGYYYRKFHLEKSLEATAKSVSPEAPEKSQKKPPAKDDNQSEGSIIVP